MIRQSDERRGFLYGSNHIPTLKPGPRIILPKLMLHGQMMARNDVSNAFQVSLEQGQLRMEVRIEGESLRIVPLAITSFEESLDCGRS